MNRVVRLVCRDGIAEVTMEDRVAKNTFSNGIVDGLRMAFDTIARDPSIRVVVITGYDTYFCCGGTREELLAILQGKLNFNDHGMHDLLLGCKVPVIAAMSGHAIGGGLVFGAYADILVLGAECMYSANFMKYGFTPGMGGTYMLPKVFGPVLAREMMMTARNYQGKELGERGAGVRVVPRAEVHKVAMNEAKNLADMERKALILLKNRLREEDRKGVPHAVAEELKMHGETFSGDEVHQRIMSRFGA